MALERKDRIKEQTTTTGTGDVTLNGTSPTGFLGFSGNISDGATVRYLIETTDQSEWEVGEGIFTATGTTLSRDTIYSSSNSGSLVNFSVGTKNVSVVFTAIDINSIMSELNPIGTIREFNVPTNPATLLGFGTWAAYGTGRVTISLDSGDTDFDTVDKTGGEKTHTLAETEMPSHRHNTGLLAGGTLGTANADDRAARMYGGTLDDVNFFTELSGGGAAHNNIQPYIVVYRWVRTA